MTMPKSPEDLRTFYFWSVLDLHGIIFLYIKKVSYKKLPQKFKSNIVMVEEKQQVCLGLLGVPERRKFLIIYFMHLKKCKIASYYYNLYYILLV